MTPTTEAPLRVYVDITDTLRSPWRAGIQRVVAKLVTGLGGERDELQLVPVVWSDLLRAHRRLTDVEADQLASGRARPHHAPAGDPGRAGTLIGHLRRIATGLLRRLGVLPLLRELRRRSLLLTRNRFEAPLALLPETGSVFLDLDTVWNVTQVDRTALYRDLQQRGVGIAVMVYDLLPIEYPDWFEDSLVRVFTTTLVAQAEHADAIMAISDHTGNQLVTWAADRHVEIAEPTTITLGADLRELAGPPRELPAALQGGEYVLVVGTVEPRKNHATLLDAFDLIRSTRPDLHLVVVGRAGWSNDEVIARLEAHDAVGKRLHWIQDADDDLLTALYLSAAVVAVPSVTEGFGLPVIEALSLGVPVVSSNGGALPEAGGDLVDLVDPFDTAGWAESLARHIDGEAGSDGRSRADLSSYRAPEWADACGQVEQFLVDQFGGSNRSR